MTTDSSGELMYLSKWDNLFSRRWIGDYQIVRLLGGSMQLGAAAFLSVKIQVME